MENGVLVGGLEEGVWRRAYGGEHWRRINDEIKRMERVEHNTNIVRNVMNDDDI